MNPAYDEVLKAYSMRETSIKRTPLIHSPAFGKITGSDVYLKAEFRQKTGSFKIRGAYYKIRSLSEEEKRRGVIAASAGNHAQGVAFASSLEGHTVYDSHAKERVPRKGGSDPGVRCRGDTRGGQL